MKTKVRFGIISVCCTLLYSTFLKAQETSQPEIAVVARQDVSAITLRWAPTRAGLWQQGQARGYIVERAELDAANTIIPGTERRLTASPLHPWSLEEWKRRSSRDNKYAAIAAQMLYGKSFKTTVQMNEFAVLQNAADEFENRFSFSLFAADNDTLAAQGQALRFVDETVEYSKTYTYRISLAGSENSVQGYTVARALPFELQQAAVIVEAQGLDGEIRISWRQLGEQGYTGYIIRRSDDNGNTFKRLNTNPLVGLNSDTSARGLIVFKDTTITNYHRYRYAISGITPFAEETIPVEVATYGRDLTPPPVPVMKMPVQSGARSMKISWEIPPSRDIAGFDVYRSAGSHEGMHSLVVKSEEVTPRERLLAASVREFTDTEPNEEEAFYTVAVVDTAGNIAMSLPAMSVYVNPLPPPPPAQLAGTIDTNGIVQLNWNDVPLSRVKGFRVYRANDPTHEFGEVSRGIIDDTTFTDTVNITTLTRNVYYTVRSIETNYRQSEPSQILVLLRPDVVVPVAPLLTDIRVTDSVVSLSWRLSASRDIREQRIQRRNDGTEWQTIATISPREDHFTDMSAVGDNEFEYRIIAVDSVRLESQPSLSLSARIFGQMPVVAALTASYDESLKTITLQWRTPVLVKDRSHRIIIYRAVGTEPLEQYASLDEDATTYTDNTAQESGVYRYAVRILSEGMQTDISEEITARVP
ncbi:MAG TPA: hypothetical protein VEC36_12560 [Patescibacteria group bacterium]|nr:hypothetical protein [Patescibacteria group bacterium]